MGEVAMNVHAAAAPTRTDRVVLALVLFLAALGLLMVYSVSQPLAGDEPLAFLKTQGLYVIGGLLAMFAVSRMNLHRLNDARIVVPALALILVALVLVYVPPFAAPAKNANRWLRYPFHMQPSEFAKGVLVLFYAFYLARIGERIRDFWRGVAPMALVTLPFLGLIVKEPDLGGAAAIGAMLIAMLFIGGARKRIIGLGFLAAVPLGLYVILVTPWRLKRLLGFLDPAADTLGVNWQSWQAQIAIGRGGVFGVGIGNGWQKLHYVPEMHTDFILANLGEELGLIGLLMVFFLFFVLVWRAIRLTMKADEPFLRLLGVGASALMGLQIVWNAGVVMSLLPNKGMSLPFFSYGGSCTLLNFFLAGLILGVSRQRVAEPALNHKVVHVLPRHDRLAGESSC
jgi:cell division protein FtsW